MNIFDILWIVFMGIAASALGYLSFEHYKEMGCYADWKMKLNLFGLATCLALMFLVAVSIMVLMVFSAIAKGAYHVN